MEGTGSRRRSSSFHSDPDAPPLPDFSGLQTDLEPYDPSAASAAAEAGAEEAEEPDFDQLVQSRSRSQSLHDSEEDISKQIVANAHVHPIVPPKQDDHLELAGPIHDREVSALKKVSLIAIFDYIISFPFLIKTYYITIIQGLEEATGMRDEQAEKEEQAELMAAARERLKRSSKTVSSTNVQAGLDPINRKVKVLLLGDSGGDRYFRSLTSDIYLYILLFCFLGHILILLY
jgi:hypothetical protein